MKVHKINNVDLQACNVEQKFAYNYLYCYAVTVGKDGVLRVLKNDILSNRVNKQAIEFYINKGFDNFMNLKYKILTSYKEVGALFN